MADVNNEELLAALPSELQEDCRKVYQESLNTKKYVLTHKYNVGLLAKKAIELEQSSPKYKKLLKKVQQYLHITDKRVIDRCYKFVCMFTKDEVDEISKPTITGFSICWSHFDYALVGYITKEQIVSYLEYAKENGVAPRTLYHQIMDENGREGTLNSAKRITTAKDFLKTAKDYMDSCATKDAWLADVSDEDLEAWKEEMDAEAISDLARQLDSHLVKCFLLRERLSR